MATSGFDRGGGGEVAISLLCCSNGGRDKGVIYFMVFLVFLFFPLTSECFGFK